MKAKLEYQLPEEETEYKLAVNGGSYYAILCDLDCWLRKLIKYDGTISKDTRAAYEECRKAIDGLVEDRGVGLHV